MEVTRNRGKKKTKTLSLSFSFEYELIRFWAGFDGVREDIGLVIDRVLDVN